jgi:hypothetical protein
LEPLGVNDPRKKLNRGDRISHEAYNRLIDTANLADTRLQRVGPVRAAVKEHPTGWVLVRNTTAALVDQWGVLALNTPIITEAENLDEFQQRPTFDGVSPTSTDTGRFVILQEPLEPNAIGRAVISGVTVGKVWVTAAQLASPPKRAEVAASKTSSLDLTDTGTAEVLYQETLSVEGEAWAILRLGTAGAAGAGGTDPDASATVRGYVSLLDQTLGDGVKTFQKNVRIRTFGTGQPWRELLWINDGTLAGGTEVRASHSGSGNSSDFGMLTRLYRPPGTEIGRMFLEYLQGSPSQVGLRINSATALGPVYLRVEGQTQSAYINVSGAAPYYSVNSAVGITTDIPGGVNPIPGVTVTGGIIVGGTATGGYTNEQAQDAVGNYMLTGVAAAQPDGSQVDLVYDDTAPSYLARVVKLDGGTW